MQRLATEIYIGGNIPASLVPTLCFVIGQHKRFWCEWGDEIFTPENAEDLLDACMESGPLHLCDPRAMGGTFNKLESLLRVNEIHYTRCTTHEGEVYEFRGDGLIHMPLNDDGEVVVAVEKVRPVVKMLEDALASMQKGEPGSTVCFLGSAAHMLRQVLTPIIEPLEPFGIV